MLEVSTQQDEACDIVSAKGRIDSATADDLKETFDGITNAGRYKIVFNMHDVTFISSAGLRYLIETMKTCKRFSRGNLILTDMPDPIRAALEIAGLVPVFTIYDSESEARQSF